ncbi:MAG: hypothetical protein IPK15_09060 [Verrucomicrobia bacterium]|nr:hypothetical protein [Verrucomicrobiota bacterium]
MKTRTKRLLVGFAAVVGLAIVVMVGFFKYVMRSFDQSLQPVTDLARYPEIKAQWSTNLVSHFPAAAPDSAVFYFQAGFLQGGSSLQLKVSMSDSEIASELSKISNNVLATYHGGNVNVHANETNGIPTTFFFTNETNDHTFPGDYAVMVIKADRRGGNSSWNHGATAGVAVSTQRHVVVYWAEDW